MVDEQVEILFEHERIDEVDDEVDMNEIEIVELEFLDNDVIEENDALVVFLDDDEVDMVEIDEILEIIDGEVELVDYDY